MWLFSTYIAHLARPLLVRADSAEPVVMWVNLKGWDAELSLIPQARPGRVKLPGSRGWHLPVSQLEITVVCDGGLGDELVHEEAARAIIERLSVFLQLRLKYPLFEAIERYERAYAPAGRQGAGDDGAGDDAAGALPPVGSSLQRVTGYEDQNLHDYMCELFSQELCQGLIHDAAVSIAQGRSRRACLELTMACEAALRMRLESAALVKAGMGSVFMNQYSEAAEAILELFQSRDAIKQAGRGLFKFISQAKKQEIQANLTRWQGAVECMVNWLNAMNKGLTEAL